MISGSFTTALESVLYKMKVKRARCFFSMSILERYGLTEAKITSTPAELSVKLKKDSGVSWFVIKIN